MALRDLNLERLRLLLDELGGESSESSANEEQLKLSNYFKSYMDEERIELDGLQHVLPILDLCKTATVRFPDCFHLGQQSYRVSPNSWILPQK